MSVIGELSTALYAGFRFPHLVLREFAFLSELGWTFEERSSKELLAINGRMSIRITFRLLGPSLLTLDLWITPDPTTDTENMKRLTGMGDCGPIRFCVILSVITGEYRARDVSSSPRNIGQLKADVQSMAAELRTVATTLSAAGAPLFDELATAANRRNGEYHKNMLLEIMGPDVAREWHDKSQDEVKLRYEQWLKEVFFKPKVDSN